MSFDDAITKRAEVVKDFHQLMQKGRTVGITIDELVANRIAYLKTAEEVWEAMFKDIADTGVKVFPKTT